MVIGIRGREIEWFQPPVNLPLSSRQLQVPCDFLIENYLKLFAFDFWKPENGLEVRREVDGRLNPSNLPSSRSDNHRPSHPIFVIWEVKTRAINNFQGFRNTILLFTHRQETINHYLLPDRKIPFYPSENRLIHYDRNIAPH